MTEKVFVALVDETQEYQSLQAQEAIATGRRLGVDVEAAFAENNAIRQIKQTFERIHAPEGERPGAILIQSVTGEGLERVARNAVAAGIGWLVLNRRVGYVDELRGKHPTLPIGMVSPDQVEIGRIHSRQVKALAPEGGFVLYVQGPPDLSSSQDRLLGLQESLGPSFELKVLHADWTEEGASRAVTSWLRLRTSANRRPAVVVCQNDKMAMGASLAISRLMPSWGPIPTLGVDCHPRVGRVAVDAGQLAGSVQVPATAALAVEMAVAWLRESRTSPSEVLVKPSSYPSSPAPLPAETTRARTSS